MLLRIIPFPPTQPRDQFLIAVEEKLGELLSNSVKEQIQQGIETELFESLPIFNAGPIAGVERQETSPLSFWVSFLCPGEYTSGVGRYVDDALTRWLVPGKSLPVIGASRLAFSFESLPSHFFFFGSTLLQIDPLYDAEIATRNLEPLIQEMRLNILAVYRARYIASIKSISLEQKNIMIQEHLNKIFHRTGRESEWSLFDQLHGFFTKLNREEKEGQIQAIIAQLTTSRPKSFHREMFSEMTYFTVLFKDQFATKRKAAYISRVIALHYLFKKILLDAVKKSPKERHISLKVYRTKIHDDQPVLGLLFGMNILRESEGLDRRFLLSAVRAVIPSVEMVKDSYLFDRRERKVYLFYIEVHKPSYASFTADEVNAMRARLAAEVKKQIENDVHPLFLPRNEEEIARNLILLSQQLRYSRDIPQVNIQYEKQSESALFFTIMIARLLLPKTVGLREKLLGQQTDMKFSIDEIREIGKLRGKIPKETAVLRIALDKQPFFRVDYSVDLLRARGRVAYELRRIIGEFRDFNGGLILKQEEALIALRKAIGPMSQEMEFSLEETFYAIRPGIMQTVLPTHVLKAHFFLLEKSRTLEDPVAMDKVDNYFLFIAKSGSFEFKARVEIAVERLKIPSYELTSCYLQIQPMNYLGYILRSDKQEEADLLFQALEENRSFSLDLRTAAAQ